ncbi:hypothetical protein FRB99_006859 [Tulasnella sp. 403]|nr:hypothetical protein FRB99_006859 [Tulasnella sp. 403]
MDAFITIKKSSTQAIHKDTLPKPKTRLVPQADSGEDASNIKQEGSNISTIPTLFSAKLNSPQSSSLSLSRAVAARQTAEILKTLKDASNPITHDLASKRSEYITSCATGHERSEGSRRSSYFKSRNQKLREQQQNHGLSGNVLRGVRAYIGYCETNTDIELRRTISMAGGTTTYNESSATHIITSQWLSASKTQSFLNGQRRTKLHVVSPAWLDDSIKKGKRQSEWRYSQVQTGIQKSVYQMHKRNTAGQSIDNPIIIS